jgi:hypothetical protein
MSELGGGSLLSSIVLKSVCGVEIVHCTEQFILCSSYTELCSLQDNRLTIRAGDMEPELGAEDEELKIRSGGLTAENSDFED